MIDFRVSDGDQAILDQLVAMGMATEGRVRHHDEHEFEELPRKLPELAAFPRLPSAYRERQAGDTPANTFRMLVAIVVGSTNGLPFDPDGGTSTAPHRKQGLGNVALEAAGTPQQIARWGTKFLAMSITEPNAGSDTKAIQTAARLDGGEWVLNGDKIFVTDGVRCDGAVVWATLDRVAGRAGIKSFVVMKGTPGFEVVRQERKLGIRQSDTAAYAFQECRVPRDHLLGGDEAVRHENGSGSYRGVLRTFNMTRPGVAAGGVGKAIGAIRFATEALRANGLDVDWNRSFHERSATEQKLIEMEADAEAAALLILRAAWLADMGEPNNLEASASKAKGGEVARTVPQRAMELLGAMSISHDHLVEKYMRDGRITDIWEGTGQIQRLILARSLLGFSADQLK